MNTRRYISSIYLENFGAFYKSGYDRIVLEKGENLLVYGENGSGKSSLYKALSQFFDSSENAITFNTNQLAPNDNGRVEITFTNEEEIDGEWKQTTSDIYKYNAIPPSNNNAPFIRLANRIRGFLSYQQLVKSYTLPTRDGANPNLYELVIEGLLWYHKLARSNRTIENFWNELKTGFAQKHAGRKLFRSAVFWLPIFNDDLMQLVFYVNLRVNYWLQHYFNYDLEVKIQSLRVSLQNPRYSIHKDFYLTVEHFNKPYAEYHNFLNEARLSALAICYYLAGIKLNPTGTNYKLLFLDDIFIGLDTSNRLPLLEILKSEFSDFQIFIATYDRNWFELAKEQLNPGKWKLIEMFHDDVKMNIDGVLAIVGEKPVIVESSFTFLRKAKQYFSAKDFPACSNYLRKEVERIVRKLLPIERRVNIDENFGTRDETKLENLLNNFSSYIRDCNIILPEQTIESIKLYRSLVLNPQSHSDIQSPIYRAELEKAFDAIQKLSMIPDIIRTTIVTINSIFVYRNPSNNYNMELVLADNIYKVSCGSNLSISKYRLRIANWNWNGVQYATKASGVPMPEPQLSDFCDGKRTLEQVFRIITHAPGNTMPQNLESGIFLAGRSLEQLLA